MIRVKLPFGGITPEQMEAFADVDRAVRAAEQGPHHDAPEHPDAPHPAATTPPKLIRELVRRRPVLAARAAATPSATSPATRGPASREDELFDPTPYAGAYVRYFVRHPTTQLMPRKVKTAFTARRRGPRDHRHPRHRLHRARARRRQRGFEMRVGGGTSIMPRIAPDALRLRRAPTTASTSRSPRPSSASSTARTGCASTAPAPASRSSSTSSASTSCAGWSRRSSRATGSPSATSTSTGLLLRRRRGGQRARRAARAYASPNGDGSRVRALPRVQRHRPAPGGLLRRRGPRPPRRPDARAVPRPRPIMRDYSRRLRPHDRRTRTSCCAGCATRRVYEVWQRLRELGLGDARRRRDHRRRPLPRHRLAASSASRARWASTRAIRERLEEMEITDPLTAQASTSR